MKKIVIIILGIVVIIGGYFVYDQTRFKASDIVLKWNDKKEFEYGEFVDSNSLVKESSGEVTCQVALDTMRVGKQDLVFVVKENGKTKEFHLEVEVKDTKAPQIVVTKEKDNVAYGSTFEPQKYIKSVNDPIDGELPYKRINDVQENDVYYYTYQSDVNTKQPKDYIVHYIAVDKNNNKTEKSITIIVQKEVNQNINSSSYTPTPNNMVIVIDPGHQGKGNSSKEAIGPGSSTTKAKVTTGATGVSSRKAESQMNLEIALKLRDELKARGYTVVMTRTSQNVNISNQQRAKVGNQNNAAAVIHLHCDSSNSSSIRGAHTIAVSKKNPFCPQLYSASSSLAQKVINSYTSATGIKSRGVSYQDDLTGLNWSTVPAIYIEMGFISNSTEDKLLSSSSFQKKCAQGIANGIDQYLK